MIRCPLNNVFCDEINRIVVLDKILEDPLDSKINLVNPKEINVEYSLEGLRLKLQYYGYLIQKVPDAGKN